MYCQICGSLYNLSFGCPCRVNSVFVRRSPPPLLHVSQVQNNVVCSNCKRPLLSNQNCFCINRHRSFPITPRHFRDCKALTGQGSCVCQIVATMPLNAPMVNPLGSCKNVESMSIPQRSVQHVVHRPIPRAPAPTAAMAAPVLPPRNVAARQTHAPQCATVYCYYSPHVSSAYLFCKSCNDQKGNLENNPRINDSSTPCPLLTTSPWMTMDFSADKQTLRCTLGDLSPEFQSKINPIVQSAVFGQGKLQYNNKTYCYLFYPLDQNGISITEFFFLRKDG